MAFYILGTAIIRFAEKLLKYQLAPCREYFRQSDILHQEKRT